MTIDNNSALADFDAIGFRFIDADGCHYVRKTPTVFIKYPDAEASTKGIYGKPKAVKPEDAWIIYQQVANILPIDKDILSTQVTWLVDGMADEVKRAQEPFSEKLPSDVGQEKLASAQVTDQPASHREQLLAQLLDRELKISEAATRPVVFSPPLVSREGIGVIGRGTINIIQGAYGSHKSRFAELMASLMLTTTEQAPHFLGFERARLERFSVAYIDTERNQGEELPAAIQNIKTKAGYGISDQPAEFRFTSIKATNRKDRFTAIDAFISHVRQKTSLHLFCLIDVVTDAISDFNDPKESMALYDFVGNLCDYHDVTFLLVIHQNPGTEKARGHTGTEAANKASTVLQIGYERDASGNETDLIRLRYLKLRRNKKPSPLYLQFDEQSKGLVLADAAQIAALASQRKQKADAGEIADRIVSLLKDGALQKSEVVDILMSEFGASNATIRSRLKGIMEEPPSLCNEEGKAIQLIDYSEGQRQYYKLSLVANDADTV